MKNVITQTQTGVKSGVAQTATGARLSHGDAAI